MAVRLHPHAAARAAERGATEAEVAATVETGETIPAKHGRTGFRRNFPGPWTWRARAFDTKQVLVYAVPEGDGWLVITVIVKFLGGRA
ncbi:DUF4258 domain-containing protein [Rhodosalinus sp.]|uniref:DUF4258 domain-containing protein n=1 Tax=Rhodosalinus sp. TaxID=2047741 RepID=UPI003562B77F